LEVRPLVMGLQSQGVLSKSNSNTGKRIGECLYVIFSFKTKFGRFASTCFKIISQMFCKTRCSNKRIMSNAPKIPYELLFSFTAAIDTFSLAGWDSIL